ncbi:MAG: BrnT family toxin, partial [Verrucomicrobia bacterium]|nr:BrnT family toxin [Verrucomicrobiota bacterium]
GFFLEFMDFDWSTYSTPEIPPTEVHESFEDPFCLRILPGGGALAEHSRFLCLGKSLAGKSLFSLYSSDGRKMRPISSRLMTDAESYFYERKVKESL